MFSRAFLFLFCTVVSTASSAAIVTYSYTGVLLGETAKVTGSFGYDNQVADALPQDPSIGRYDGAGFWNGVVEGGPQNGMTFDFHNIDITVFNGYSGFGDGFSSFVSTADNMSSFDFGDASGTAFSDDRLPMFLALGDFDFAEFTLGELELEYTYGFESISAPKVVPLPPAVWLFGSALMGFVAWGRKKRSS